jgi:hypothetical protein
MLPKSTIFYLLSGFSIVNSRNAGFQTDADPMT